MTVADKPKRKPRGFKRVITATDTVATLVKKGRGNGRSRNVRLAANTAAVRERKLGSSTVRKLPESILNAAEAMLLASYGFIDEKELLGLTKADAPRIARVGLGLLARDKNDAAHAAGQLAAWLDDNSAEAWMVWAAAAARLGKEAEAIGAYQKALTLAPDHLPASVDLAELHIRRLQYAEAAKRLDFVLKADPKALTPAGKRAQVLVVNTLMQLEGA